MAYVAIYTGLRVSELAGLKWDDIHEESITNHERYCRGDWGAPRRGKKRNKPYLTPAQFKQLLELIPEPYATMAYVAIYTGLRVSELAGLKWDDIHEESITIDERYCRGDWGAPKSDCSNATIGVNRCVLERIHGLRTLTVCVRAGLAARKYRAVKSDGPNDLVFQSVRDGKPIRDNNILARFIKPAARRLDFGWVN
jgi:integrase